jgi:hypothetical protein
MVPQTCEHDKACFVMNNKHAILLDNVGLSVEGHEVVSCRQEAVIVPDWV